jgi:hypothetical protein
MTYLEERNAMVTILHGLPPDVLIAIGEKENAKAAWDAIATQRMGASRVCEANAQKPHRDFEGISFRDGEIFDDFSLRLSGIITNLLVLVDNLEESKVLHKFPRVVPSRFAQVAIAIETQLDVSALSLVEVTGRLRVIQDRLDNNTGGTRSGGRQLLTEEEWEACKCQPPGDGGSSSSGWNNRQRGGGHSRGGSRDGHRNK